MASLYSRRDKNDRSQDDRRPELVAVAISFIFLTAFTVAIRIYTQLRVMKKIGNDGILIIIAGILATGMSVCQIYATKFGLGRHVEYQTLEMEINYDKLTLFSAFCYNGSSSFVKLSLLVFYLRLSQQRAFKITVWTMIFVCIGFCISSNMTVYLQCFPIKKLWDEHTPGKCMDGIVAFYFANAGINILTDIIVYIIPIRVLLGLKLPNQQKVGLVGIFSLGILVVTASIVRLVILGEMLASNDIPWTSAEPFNWSTIEVHISVFIASAPAFKAFLNHYFPGFLGPRTTRTYGHGYGGYQNSFRLSSTMRTNVRPGQDPGRLTGVNTTNIIYNNKKGPGESEETIIVPQNGVLVGRTVKVTHEYVDPQPEQGEVEVDVELRETKTAASEVTIDTV